MLIPDEEVHDLQQAAGRRLVAWFKARAGPDPRASVSGGGQSYPAALPSAPVALARSASQQLLQPDQRDMDDALESGLRGALRNPDLKERGWQPRTRQSGLREDIGIFKSANGSVEINIQSCEASKSLCLNLIYLHF